jgi:hypothetical protein
VAAAGAEDEAPPTMQATKSAARPAPRANRVLTMNPPVRCSGYARTRFPRLQPG